ncbi:glycosyltransferase family 4 protein [Paenibacillus sp. OAS669]|uniref:glycosyltransferase family 4 protein n=1 Tax=Paenibacillus sp. OAS669 TaxID=2663821 RepID=UPI00178B37AD|nr:glycosyltransferase family 4 protein [Paenibacillus sp. OAS669]MBE1442649.1 glycosyltransferase involved in cell wall biosynthesis [Paenibacillus sp. OAS669]
MVEVQKEERIKTLERMVADMGGFRSPYIWVMTTEFSPLIIGGLGTVATNLSQAMGRKNMEMIVWNQGSGKQVTYTRQNGLLVIGVPRTALYFDSSKRSYKIGSLRRAASKYIRRKPDVIHVHSLEYAREALFYKKKYRIPIVYTCHSLVESGQRWEKILREIILGADRVIAPSKWLRGNIVKRYPKASSKTIVIPHGITPSSQASQAPWHKLLYVGRMISSKGVTSLVEATGMLARKRSKLSLTIIGKGSSKYRNRLAAIARRKGFASKVRFLGFIPPHKIKHKYASFGIVVVPSIQGESFCLTALEAMAYGNPLVSTRAGGLKEFVNHRNSQIIPYVTSKAIATSIEQVLTNPAKTKWRIRNAKLMARRYRWPDIAERYKKLFVRLKRRK